MSEVGRPLTSQRQLPLISRAHSRPNSCEVLPYSGVQTASHGSESAFQFGRRSTRSLRLQPHTPEVLAKNQLKLSLISTYRNFDQLTLKSSIKRKSVPELQYFTEIHKQHLKPELTIFTHKNSQTRINFQEFGLGDDYAAAMCVAISNNPYLEAVNFKNNRLGESGSLRIIDTVRVGRVRELDLSENPLGVKSVEALAQLVKESIYLEKLALERVVLKRPTLHMILSAVSESHSLLELNLARTGITSISGSEFFTLLTTNSTLKRLDLHWNTLGDVGAVPLFRGLSENISLQELDVSWNSIGNSASLDACQAICKLFGENESVKHLDLSYNYFSFEECEKLADGIKANHTILGVHMLGNNCDFDPKGFLIPIQAKRKDMAAHLLPRMLSPKQTKATHGEKGNCWLCEKWEAVTFVWDFQHVVWNRRLKRIVQDLQHTQEPVFLHMDIDNFQPELLLKDADGTYKVTRAVPSTGVKFFFTYRGYAQVSFLYSLFTFPDPQLLEVTYFSSVSKRYSLVLMNSLEHGACGCTLGSPFPVLPRPIHWVYEGDPNDRVPFFPDWTVENSIFRTYKFDTPQLLKDCLDFDWEHSRLTNLIKSESERVAVKSVLSDAYAELKELFRMFCSFEKFGVSKMTLSALTDIANTMKLIDNRAFRLSDLDTNIRASLTELSVQHISSISRTEFIEIMVRVAVDKYLKTGICRTEAEAVEKLMDINVRPFVGQCDSNVWRRERYLNEDNDVVLSAFQDTLHALYSRYSGKYAQGSDRPWMSLDEFTQLCKYLSLSSKFFSTRQYALCYQLSLMTHKDLLASKRQFQMAFVEFMEAFARVVDFKDLQDAEKAILAGNWSKEPLADKLEAVLTEVNRMLKLENAPKRVISGSIVSNPPDQ